MINVRRSDGRALNWILAQEAKEGEKPELGYCTDVECEGWAQNPEVEDGIRWTDAFWRHMHVEDWDQTKGQPR